MEEDLGAAEPRVMMSLSPRPRSAIDFSNDRGDRAACAIS